MKCLLLIFVSMAISLLATGRTAKAQEPGSPRDLPALDGSDLDRHLLERQEKINKLSPEERELLEEASRKAVAEPEVKAALSNRDRAIFEFREAVRKSMLEADPSLKPLLEKLSQTATR